MSKILVCVTMLLWRRFASFLNIGPSFKVVNNKNHLSGATDGDGRPNETRLHVPICKSEHQDVNIQKAAAELTKKHSVFNHVEYGLKIVFLPVIAAAGTDIEFAFVDGDTNPVLRNTIVKYNCTI